ncbi:hypothetical protein TKK_0016418 [Trichogramma kaykai]
MFVKCTTLDEKITKDENVEITWTFRQLKFILEVKCQIPSQDIRLYYQYRLVEDDRTFQDYNVNSGDIIKMEWLNQPHTYNDKSKGAIDGIEVGTFWPSRLEVSNAGVHKPVQWGISGDPKNGAVSVVLSGGYEEDEDMGHVIFYTGSGGRTRGVQSDHQTLTGCNEGLAKNCKVNINRCDGIGVLTSNWNDCEPVRVVRQVEYMIPEEKNANKCRKISLYRYDGLYRICGYWPILGRCGFVLWRFLLAQDGIDQRQKERGWEFQNTAATEVTTGGFWSEVSSLMNISK